MDIKLIIGGEEKQFATPFISGRMLKETIRLASAIDTDNADEKMIDTMVDYVVRLYGNQFTMDQMYDGIASDVLIPCFIDSITKVTGQLNVKMEKFKDPNV
jgi:hypothetical protein